MTCTPPSPLALLHKSDRPVPRYTSYPTATAFTPAVTGADLAAALAELGQASDEAPLSLYVHVPFCRHACWYCGCNRVTTQAGSKAVRPYLEAIARELALVAAASGRRRRLAQMHWGGGTPNTLTDEEIERLWALIADHFDLDQELEASIEVNPEFLSGERVAVLRRLGFSRISFGIQDADPAVQRAVNRVIATDQLRRAMGWMREAGFASVNVDLICGLPLQTLERFGATLDLVRDLRPERISLFSFAYLPEQLPMQRHIAATDLPSRAERLQMLEEASRRLGAAGYEAIGMDHYALRDDSLAVAAREGRLHRNFQGYTTGGELDLVGIGPSAISQFRHLSSQNERNLWAWQRAVAEGRLPVERGVRVDDPLVLQRRAIIRDLMCRFQVELPAEGFEEEWAELAALQADGLVRCHPMPGRRVEVSEVGRWLIRTVAAVFDPAQRQRACGSRLL